VRDALQGLTFIGNGAYHDWTVPHGVGWPYNQLYAGADHAGMLAASNAAVPEALRALPPGARNLLTNYILPYGTMGVGTVANGFLLFQYSLATGVIPLGTTLLFGGGLAYLLQRKVRADLALLHQRRTGEAPTPPPTRNEDLAYLFGRHYYEHELALRLPPDFNWAALGGGDAGRAVTGLIIVPGLGIFGIDYTGRVLKDKFPEWGIGWRW
jgi:hypothetical protein